SSDVRDDLSDSSPDILEVHVALPPEDDGWVVVIDHLVAWPSLHVVHLDPGAGHRLKLLGCLVDDALRGDRAREVESAPFLLLQVDVVRPPAR
ncbi:hypothetical protein PENTCL1PPCAC_30597, partial [Pristionchus entomophagus]